MVHVYYDKVDLLVFFFHSLLLGAGRLGFGVGRCPALKLFDLSLCPFSTRCSPPAEKQLVMSHTPFLIDEGL